MIRETLHINIKHRFSIFIKNIFLYTFFTLTIITAIYITKEKNGLLLLGFIIPKKSQINKTSSHSTPKSNVISDINPHAADNIEKFNCIFKNNSAMTILIKNSNNITSLKTVARRLTFFEQKHNDLMSTKEKLLLNRDPALELQMVLYRKDIIKHLNTSLKTAVAKAPLPIQTIYYKAKNFIKYYLEINKAGGINNLALMPPTQMEGFNNFLLNAIRSAAPFPPLPKCFQGDFFVIFE